METVLEKRGDLGKMAQAAAMTDMGSGSIRRWMVSLAMPAVIAQIINLLYNIVDRIYIGHIAGIGTTALTGVGLCMPILTLINAFAMLCGAGGPPRAAIALGQGNRKGAERILGNCLTVLIGLAVVLTAFFFAFAPQLLWRFGASDATLPYAVSYARIYVLGSIFTLIVMGLNPFITTQGFARLSMMTTIIGALCNIVLDPILIFGFGLGVRGAAIATVFSQGVSAVWVLRFLTGPKAKLKLRRENLRISLPVITPCLALGVSTFVMMSTESLLSISFSASLSRYGGDLAVGAMTIITSVSQLISMPLQGVCQGGQPLISYNFGAGKADRVRRAFRCQFSVCVGYAGLFWVAVMLFPHLFAAIFSTDQQLIDYTVWAMRIYMAGIFSSGFQTSCQQSFVALSQAVVSLLLACLRKLILLIPLIFILPFFFQDKVFAVFLAEPVSDMLAAAVTVTVFMTRFNRILTQGPARV